MRDFLSEPIQESISIDAPIARCFGLSTRVELVRRTLGMTLVGGVTQGHIRAGSRVHWRGLKFGLPTHHHTLITGFAAPHRAPGGEEAAWFQDSQERGRFRFFQHDHFLTQAATDAPTVLRDEVRFALPFGVVGRVVARVVLAPHIRRLARQRFAMIKELAEGEGWREWA